MSSVLFVGAGRHQRRAIIQARERGHPRRRGRPESRRGGPRGGGRRGGRRLRRRRRGRGGRATPRRRRRADGLGRPGSARRRGGAERLGLPSIGTDVARRMTHKIAMRRTLAEEGIPQPPFAAVRRLAEGRAAIDDGRASRPCSSRSTRVDSAACSGSTTPGDLESHLHAALAESPAREAILEGFVDGIGDERHRRRARRRRHAADALRPAPAARASASASAGSTSTPPRSTRDQLELAERVAERSVAALGLRDGIAFPQLIASPDGGVAVVEVAARIPGGQMADLVRHAVGVDLVDARASLRARRAGPRRARASPLLAAARDPLPHGVARAAPDGPRDAGRPARPRAREPRASSRPRRTSSRARRSGPSGSTAIVAAT